MNIYDTVKQRLQKEWPIGTRVRYVGDWHQLENATGTITNVFPGFDEQLRPDKTLDSVAVKADDTESCPYSNGSFAPSVGEIETIK